MAVYEYYTDNCAKCGEVFPMRHLNKILYTKSHQSAGAPRKLCSLCDRCLPGLLDYLEVAEPEPRSHSYIPRRWCRKCARDVGKTSEYCPYCGEKV